MRRLSVLSIIGLLAVGAWLIQPRSAEAGDVSISLGAGFVVGGATFNVVVGSGRSVPYYYRLATPLYGPGYDCTTYCHARGAHYYHAPFCPLVRFHFETHRYHGYWRSAYRYGPPYAGHRHHHYPHRHPMRYDGPRHGHHHHGAYYPRGHARGHGHHKYDGRHASGRHEHRRGPVSRSSGSAHRTRPRP